MTHARTDIKGAPSWLYLHDRRISLGHIAHVTKVPDHLGVAEFDHLLPPAEMSNNLGNQKLFRLAYTGVVEWPRDDDRQLVHPQPRHVLHRQLAHRIVVGWRWRGIFGNRLNLSVAVDVGAAGQNHELRFRTQLSQSIQQIACTDNVDAIDLVDVPVGDKRNGSQMQHHIRPDRGHRRTYRLAVEQVGGDRARVSGFRSVA